MAGLLFHLPTSSCLSGFLFISLSRMMNLFTGCKPAICAEGSVIVELLLLSLDEKCDGIMLAGS